MNDKHINYWNKRGETYNVLDDVKSNRTAYKIINYIKTLNLASGSWILDAGCGSGNITKNIRDNFRHSNVVGIDLSSVMIEKANLKARNGLKFYNIDFFDFIKDMNSFFDFVMASLFIHHLTSSDDQRAIDGMYRILNENGHILIAEAIPPADSIFDYYSQIFSIKEDRNCYTLSMLLKLLRSSGFVDIKFMTYNFDIRLLSWLNDKTLSDEKKKLLYSMHVSSPEDFKKAYSMEPLLGGDYRLRCKMALVSGQKKNS